LISRWTTPSNILLESIPANRPTKSPFRVFLTDFGIAKLVTGTASNTGIGMMGTLDYMAPEQIQSARSVDHYADIYALGVIAYRMVTGVLPFTGEHPGEVLAGHLYAPFPDPREAGLELPDSVVAALERALAKEPSHRFPSASELATALSY
jgi:serine/threonine-protein kinase